HPFPNTYYVKATDPPLPDCWAQGHDRCAAIRKGLHSAAARDAGKLRTHGLHYISRWFEQTALLWASPLAVLGLIARPRSLRFAFAWLAVIVIGVYLYYVDGVGGDFMGLHRFIMPLFVLAAILVTLGL